MELFCAVECPLDSFVRTVSVVCVERTVSIAVEFFAFEYSDHQEKIINLLLRLSQIPGFEFQAPGGRLS